MLNTLFLHVINHAKGSMLKFFYFLLLLVMLHPASAQSGQEILKKFTNDPKLSHAGISIAVKHCNTGELLMASQAQQSVTPASVLKLVTTATALEVLGPEFRFQSKIACSGKLTGKSLYGSLKIIAGGDPSLGSIYFNPPGNRDAFLKDWASRIRQAGIDTLYGNIEVDQSIYSDRDVPRSWPWEDLGNYYGAAAAPLAVYDNTFELVFRTAPYHGGPTEVIDTFPKIPGLILQNEVLASDDQRDLAFVFGSPFDSYRVIRGTLPKNKAAFRIKASIPDPAALLLHDLKQHLIASGLTIIQPEITLQSSKPVPDSILFVHESPALAELIKVINHESMNLYAEHLCKHLGLIMNGNGTTEAGVKAMVNYWRSRGVKTEAFFMVDGSGLSRANALSAEMLTSILLEMKKSRHFEVFQASIPLTGLEGTQQFYFHDSFLKGKAHAKSGSMTRVRSFAGYMTTRKGTPLAFAIMVNNFNGSSMETAKKMEELMENIYLLY